MTKLFGTDGIRGLANTEISCELALNVGRAVATIIGEDLENPPTILVGRDTRLSGTMLSSAIFAGLASVGAHCIDLQVVPTPAVACLVQKGFGDAGIMISASHNPYDSNGIKVFGQKGYKLTEDQEYMVEKLIESKAQPFPLKWGSQIGAVSLEPQLVNEYISHLLAGEEKQDFSSFHIALDCAHGSATATVEALFNALGVKTTIINNKPDGININHKAGSTHMESLMALVKSGNYDAGFAFDGDADRCLMVDEKGGFICGDRILAILATDLRSQGLLKNNAFVATIMSNLGLAEFGEKEGFTILNTKVGDRYVQERMEKEGYVLGGEQSGHIILSHKLHMGDGQLTAIYLLGALARSGKKASQLAQLVEIYPQYMVNIQANNLSKSQVTVDEGALNIIKSAKETLGATGRVLVRPSGTEPLIRIMMEGKDLEQIKALTHEVAEELSERLTLIQSGN